MAVEVTYPHIEVAPDQPARLRRVPRVRVAQIAMDYLAHGWSVDEMCRQHPYLMPGEAHAAMAYYFDHHEDIDAEISAELAEVKQARDALERSPEARSPFFLRLRAKGLL